MSHRYAACCAVVVVALCPPAGQAVDIEPAITIAEIYTSNVELAPGPNADGDWVTRIAPSLRIGYSGQRLQLDLDYLLEGYFYANDSDRNEMYNQLESVALLNLIGEDLQLRGRAGITQVNISPTRSVASSNIYTTGNRTDATTWNVGPRWHHPILGNSLVDGYFEVGHVNYDDPTTQDLDTLSGHMSVGTMPESSEVISYGLVYDYDKLKYQESGDVVVASAYLRLGYQLTPELQLFALGGLDSDFENPRDASLTEARWEAGFATTFGADRIEAAYGHRFFGPTYRFSWTREAAGASYSASYSESPATSDLTAEREISVVLPGGEPVPPPPDPGIDRLGTATLYVLKRADVSGSWVLYRSRLLAALFWEERQNQTLLATTPGDASVGLNDEQSYGVNLDFTWELGAKSDVTFGAGWRHRTFDNIVSGPGTNFSDEDELYTLEANLEHRLGLRTSLRFGAGYQSRQGTADSSGDFDEAWARAELRRTF